MPEAGDELNLSPIGAVFRVIRTAAETDGRALEMQWLLEPGAHGTPVHIHPSATETYEVLEGKLDLYVDGAWKVLGEGERGSAPPGTPHTFRNSSRSRTRVFNTHSPAMRFGDYFETIHRIVDSGVIEPSRMTPKAMLYLSMVMTRFEDEIISVRPPQIVVRIASRVARLLGYRIPAPKPRV